MEHKPKVFKPEFDSKSDEIAYLQNKITFLLSHSQHLADREINITNKHKHKQPNNQLKELRDIKNSRSWRITLPLRKANRILQELMSSIDYKK